MQSILLSSQEQAWLHMASAQRVASKQWLEALDHYQCSALTLLTDLPNVSVELNELKAAIAPGLVEKAINWACSNPAHHLVYFGSSFYPDALKQLVSPPLVLFVIGEPELLKKPQVAIVGSRRASNAGKTTAQEFAQGLSAVGITVTSGLATGIDSAAHRGGLTGNGRTIAVMGTGPDVIYPSKNKALANSIVDAGGAIISEFFPGQGPKPWHFPRRNRIIAALSMGTVVVEAKIKSGTLITANLAADLGKEVFAVPGSIFHAYTEGCHWLIQQGAKLVTKVNDIFDEFAIEPQQLSLGVDVEKQKSEVNSLATDKLLASVDYDITAIDVIAQRNAVTVDKVMASLLEYELRGLVAAVPGGYVKLRGK
ncbi:DNA-processing protein DprA [Alteromonas sp. McT4-15]|uniref:DNA-processing protein DprA n=1 Tax=Alteromonas sp. McT4-15 TaxID=2881256 RepID=UPI001CF7FE13|nr:DNA-processing protein DprA [Alteromonas sp. McT4-15]MCB4437294.1 DNA-processing protein DprA [Alteromonas sp. McT4-15]MEC8231785.1 DNA-processing protein DprA [Pseudomonadota bacterium]